MADAVNCDWTQFDNDRFGTANTGSSSEKNATADRGDIVAVEFIRDVCANRPWLEGVTKDSVAHYRRLRRGISAAAGSDGCRRWRRMHLAAFAIYVQARQAGCGITPQLMHDMTGVDMSKLRTMERTFGGELNEDCPQYYLAEMGQYHNLSFRDLAKIRAAADRLGGECFGCYPRTIAVALVYLYVSAGQTAAAPLTTFARSCQASPASIRSALARIAEEMPSGMFSGDKPI
jgi:hypothetical protein